jgi:hypothetical protein
MPLARTIKATLQATITLTANVETNQPSLSGTNQATQPQFNITLKQLQVTVRGTYFQVAITPHL